MIREIKLRNEKRRDTTLKAERRRERNVPFAKSKRGRGERWERRANVREKETKGRRGRERVKEETAASLARWTEPGADFNLRTPPPLPTNRTAVLTTTLPAAESPHFRHRYFARPVAATGHTRHTSHGDHNSAQRAHTQHTAATT